MAKKPSSAITAKRWSNKQMTRPNAGTLGSQEGECNTIHHRAQSPSKTKSSNDDPPSQDYLKSHTNDRGCPQPLRRSHSGTIATTTGADGINERQHQSYSFTFQRKVPAGNSGTIISSAAPDQNTECADKNIGELMAAAAERTIENKGWATDICYFLMIKHNSQISNVW